MVLHHIGLLLHVGEGSEPSHKITLDQSRIPPKNTATDSKQVVDYKDWQITLSRRFRAMKLWLVLRSYGVANLRNFLRSHVKMAKHFEELVTNDSRFEIVVPRYFAMVCFRVSPSALPFPTITTTRRVRHRRQPYGGQTVTMAWKVVQEAVDAMLNNL
ncbi:hypothetical protein GQ457_10G025000 [Hibiscus cannabinus]